MRKNKPKNLGFYKQFCSPALTGYFMSNSAHKLYLLTISWS